MTTDTVFVTGAAGFIGHHVVRLLREAGRPVRALIRPGEHTRNLDALRGPGLELVEGDILDRVTLHDRMSDCSTVYHLAALYRTWVPDTNVLRLIPQDAPQLWVRSNCGFAEAAVRAALHATPERPVFLVPVDQKSEVAQNACRTTLAALDHEGYWWLRYFPEQWLCQRFADDAAARVDGPIGLRFYAGGEFICNGLCEAAFDRIGRPELQQFVTIVYPGS